MKHFQSKTKKRRIVAMLFCVLLIISFCNTPAAFASEQELTYSQVGQRVAVNTTELEVPPKEADISSPVPENSGVNCQAMDNPNSVAGGAFAVALNPYAQAGCTLDETYSSTSAAYAFQPIIGVANNELLQMFKSIGLENCSIKDMLGLSINQWKEKADNYKDSLVVMPKKKAKSSEENTFERIINITFEIAVSAIHTSDTEVKAVFDLFDDTSATDILNSSTGMGTLLAAASVVSGVADSANEPISSLIVKSADRIDPKENGEKYTDPLDLLIYNMKTQEGLNINRDTPVRDFLKLIISADGSFVPDESRTGRYPSIYYVNGVVDPQAVFQMAFRSFSVEDISELFLAEFDGRLLDSTQINITERTVEIEGYDETESVVTISGVFTDPGYHSMQMSLDGWPFFAFIELAPANVPVTGVDVLPTNAEMIVGDLLQLNAIIAPENASNKSLIFTCDNYSVADVNQNGVITAKEPGTATITVTTADGGFTSICTVTVVKKSILPNCIYKIIEFFTRICCCRIIIDFLVCIFNRLLSICCSC